MNGSRNARFHPLVPALAAALALLLPASPARAQQPESADRTLATRESAPFVALTAELRRLLETC